MTVFPVTTRDYAFDAPDSVPAGLVRLVMMVIGGTTGLAAGGRNTVQLTLEPGSQALFCFVRTPNSNQVQHYKIGMVRSLTVIAE